MPLVLVPRSLGPGLHDAAVEACRKVGLMPSIKQEAQHLTSAIELVAAAGRRRRRG